VFGTQAGLAPSQGAAEVGLRLLQLPLGTENHCEVAHAGKRTWVLSTQLALTLLQGAAVKVLGLRELCLSLGHALSLQRKAIGLDGSLHL